MMSTEVKICLGRFTAPTYGPVISKTTIGGAHEGKQVLKYPRKSSYVLGANPPCNWSGTCWVGGVTHIWDMGYWGVKNLGYGI